MSPRSKPWITTSRSRVEPSTERREGTLTFLLYASERGAMGRDPRWDAIAGAMRRR